MHDTLDPASPAYVLSASNPPVLVSSEVHPAIVTHHFTHTYLGLWSRSPWERWTDTIRAVLSTQWRFDIRGTGPTAFVFGYDRPSQHHPLSEASCRASSSRDTSNQESDSMPSQSHQPDHLVKFELQLPEHSCSAPTATNTACSSPLRALKRKELADTTSFDDQPFIRTWIDHLPTSQDIVPIFSPSPKDDPVLATYGKEYCVDPEELCRFSKCLRIMDPRPLRSSNDWIYIRYRKNGEGENEPIRVVEG